MENQEINLEKVHRLIDSLQSQAKQSSIHGMLSTAQLLVTELRHIHTNNKNTPHTSGSVSVVMPFIENAVVSLVPLEEPKAPISAELPKGDSPVQAPTILTEAQPREASDTHSFGSIPTPAAQMEELPKRTDDDTLPAQKDLYPLQEEPQEPTIAPLKSPEYPTSIPKDSPLIQNQQPVYTENALQSPAPETPPASSWPVPEVQQMAGPVPELPQSIPTQKTEPVQIQQTEEEKRKHLAFISDNFSTWADYGMSAEAPTLVQNQPPAHSADFNNDYQQQYRDLNEQLGQPHEEWAHKMQSTPIDNLTSAIGINDRYLYISELFRGDESMYERSIITLNKFNSFQEAHAWSERELRLKLGWDTQNPITQQFEQLIKRRFM